MQRIFGPEFSMLFGEARRLERLSEHLEEISAMFETEIKLGERLIELLRSSAMDLNTHEITFYLMVLASERYVDFSRIDQILEMFSETIPESDVKSHVC